ncbi:MAG: CAP domain-containing protein [Candidatus Omnitrophota bacterium]
MLVSFLWIAITLYAPALQCQTVEPTDEEQLMLELINRARMDPPAEGIRLANETDPAILSAYAYFSVDLETMKKEFASYPPRPPLAMNEKLIQSARRHSLDMRANNFQDHTGSDGSDPGLRIDDAGYLWWGWAENIYAYAKSVEHGHAGFLVDWGNTIPGHRMATLEYDDDPIFNEVGIGIVRTASGKVAAAKRLDRAGKEISPSAVLQGSAVGPMLITIDFGAGQNYIPQVVGVVYNDLNGNQFYDIGEGLGGVKITINGDNRVVVTASSGGYSFPIAIPGQYTITASGGILTESIRKTVKILGDNIKADFILGQDSNVGEWTLY